jgi:hypothetical protein
MDKAGALVAAACSPHDWNGCYRKSYPKSSLSGFGPTTPVEERPVFDRSITKRTVAKPPSATFKWAGS